MKASNIPRLAFLSYCVFFNIQNVQAEVYSCVSALSPVGFNQKTADKLSEAIIEGEIETVAKLASHLLNKNDHDLLFTNKYGSESERDLLLFAALAATSNKSYRGDAVNSLKTLVEMGFKVPANDMIDREKWANLYWFGIAGFEDITRTQEQVLGELVKAGLTAEKLYWADGESPVHQSLLTINDQDQSRLLGDQYKFNIIVDSGLITEDNVDLPFYPRNQNYERRGDRYPHNVKTTLLHWNAAWSEENVRILIEKGANPNVTVDIIDKENVYAPMGKTPLKAAQTAANYLAVIELLKAGASRDDFNINAQIGEYHTRSLLHWAIDKETLFKASQHNIEPVKKLIGFGASPHMLDEYGESAVSTIEKQIDILDNSIARLKERLKKEEKRKPDDMNDSVQHERTILDIQMDISVKGHTLEEYQKSLAIINSLWPKDFKKNLAY